MLEPKLQPFVVLKACGTSSKADIVFAGQTFPALSSLSRSVVVSVTSERGQLRWRKQNTNKSCGRFTKRQHICLQTCGKLIRTRNVA